MVSAKPPWVEKKVLIVFHIVWKKGQMSKNSVGVCQFLFGSSMHYCVLTRGGRCLPTQDLLSATRLKTGVGCSHFHSNSGEWCTWQEVKSSRCGRCLDKLVDVLSTVLYCKWALGLQLACTNHLQWEKHHLWCDWKQSQCDSRTDLPNAAAEDEIWKSLFIKVATHHHNATCLQPPVSYFVS